MASGAPDYSQITISSGSDFEQKKISATATEATTSYTQKVKSVLFFNDGPNAVHLNFGATATTNHFKMVAKSWFFIDIPLIDIHTKCATSETATVYAIGVY